jgi:translocation and assembly module TamA
MMQNNGLKWTLQVLIICWQMTCVASPCISWKLNRESNDHEIRQALNKAFKKNASIDAQTIQKILEPFGYLNANIITNKHHACRQFQIKLGEQAKINDFIIKFDSPTSPAILKIKKRIQRTTNQPFTVNGYNDLKNKLQNDLVQLGYLKNYIDIQHSKLLLDRSKNSASINWLVHLGPRYTFGPIDIQSQGKLSRKLLRRYFSFKAGDPYSPDQINQVETRLMNSGYFHRIFIKSKSLDQATVPTILTYKLNKKKQLIVSLGYDTDLGYKSLVGLKFRLLNNMGHQAKMLLGYSMKQKYGSVSYTIPGQKPYESQTIFNYLLKPEDTAYGGKLATHLFSVTQSFIKSQSDQLLFSLILRSDKSRPVNEASYITKLLSLKFSHDKKSNHTSQSNQFTMNRSIQIEGGLKSLFSSTNYLRSLNTLTLQNQYKKHLLTGQMSFGMISHIQQDDLPLDLLYRTGGVNSIRGYGYQSIGPGRFLYLSNISYEYEVYQDLFVGVFHDRGSATWQAKPQWHDANGYSMAYKTAIGFIRLSYAKALNTTGKPWRFQLSIGSS